MAKNKMNRKKNIRGRKRVRLTRRGKAVANGTRLVKPEWMSDAEFASLIRMQQEQAEASLKGGDR